MLTNRCVPIAMLLLTVIAISALAFFHFREPWEVRAYNRIELGMTAKEVVAAVGTPPSFVITDEEGLTDYVRQHPPYNRVRQELSAGDIQQFDPGETLQVRRGPGYGFVAALAQDGKTKGKVLAFFEPAPTLFERLRVWLGL